MILVMLPSCLLSAVPALFALGSETERITSAGHNTLPVDNADSPDENRDRRADDASYAPDCPSYSPWLHVRSRRVQHEVCKL